MKNEITFKGQAAIVEKVTDHHYCKTGAYAHSFKTGWVVIIDGEIVLGGRVTTSSGHGAMRYEAPEYTTRKSILAVVDYYNGIFERRQK